MRARSLKKQRKDFFHGRPSIPVIGREDKLSKEAIGRAVKLEPVAKKSSSFLKNGLRVALVGAALSLVGSAVEKSKIERIASLKTKTNMSSKSIVDSNGRVRYTNMYPKVTPQVASSEMKEVARLIGLDMAKKTDMEIADSIFEIARKSGVTPRVALRTIARSTGGAKSINMLDEKITIQTQRVKQLEAQGRFDSANEANKVLQKTQKIKTILEEVDSVDSRTASLLRRKVNSIPPFNITK